MSDYVADILEKFNDDTHYYADRDFLSNSSLKLLKESPTKFFLWKNNKWKQPGNAAFDVGHALHSWFLEGNKTHVAYTKGARRGADYLAFKEENEGKIVLTAKDAAIVDGMYDKLMACPDVKPFLEQGFTPEVPMVKWYDVDGQEVGVKGKADALLTNPDFTSTLLDLKTTKDPIDKWARNAKWNYAQQAYLYSDLFGVKDFAFLVVQKEFPYDVGIFYCSEEFLAFGERQLQESLSLYKSTFLDVDNFNSFAAIKGVL